MKKSYILSEGLYDYSDSIQREQTIEYLLEAAKKHREPKDRYWEKMKRYYDGNHDIMRTAGEFSRNANLPFVPAQSTDGYVHVETQLCPSVPDFEFSPRDKTDFEKARQREKVVKYICDNNDLDYKNSRNERTLGICGSAVWKVCWDGGAAFGENEGDVVVLRPSPSEIYTDVGAKDVDSCEYIGYEYKLHISKAARMFEDDFKSCGSTLSDYLENGAFVRGFEGGDEDSVTVTEWWFRQPKDGSVKLKRKVNGQEKTYFYNWKAGDIALCILINGKEIRYIPKYWKKTSFNEYPFVIYSKIPDEKNVWGKSELELIIPLIDAKDRELAFAQLNSAFCSNDIILMEENALSNDENLDNSPGAVWKLRPGMMGKISRLGNMSAAAANLYANGAYFQSLIENTTGNFEVNQGKEPTNVTTATGIALLNERAESRKNQKSIDRNAGFKRLYSLIDKTALEHYSDGRTVRLGAAHEDEIVFDFGGYTRTTREKHYIPAMDVTIHTGSAISNSKAFTVSALTSLISMNINEDNYKLVKAYVEAIGIPERAEICEFLDDKFGGGEKNDIDDEDILRILEKSLDTEERI